VSESWRPLNFTVARLVGTNRERKEKTHQQNAVDSAKFGERKLRRRPVLSCRGLIPSRGGPLRGRGEAQKAEEARHFDHGRSMVFF